MTTATAPLPQRAPPSPGSVGAWLLACRPATLTAALAPVAVGSAVATRFSSLDVGAFLATMLGASLLQIASNFANDVFDYEKGADTHERLGPMRAVQAGLLTAAQMKTGLLIVIGLSLLAGLFLTFHAGWPVIAIGVSGIIAAVAYTGGPYPLGYHGWGDVFVFLFFGLVAVCGTSFVQLGHVPTLAILCSIPIGALATNILVVNNLRDRHTDQVAQKRTLAVRFGKNAILVQYIAQLSLAYGLPLWLWLSDKEPAWILLPWLSLPLALAALRSVCTNEGAALNASLVASARLVFVFGMLLALGLVFGQQHLAQP